MYIFSFSFPTVDLLTVEFDKILRDFNISNVGCWSSSQMSSEIFALFLHLSARDNALQPGVAFLYPLKTSENLEVFCFQGV